MVTALLISFGGVLAVVSPRASDAQQSNVGAEPAWQAYIGCWQPVEAPSSPSRAGASGSVLCILPDGNGEMQLVSVMADSVLGRTPVPRTTRRDASRDGCTGWERGERGSAGRIHLSSEYTCEGGISRTSSGMLAFLNENEWMDVQTIVVDGRESQMVQRYREVPPPAVVAREFDAATAGRGLAVATARIAAGAAVGLRDIAEAARLSNPATVEAWLLERRQGYRLSRSHLELLEQEGVPGRVVDIVVALSHPQAFSGELARRRLALYPVQDTPVNSARVASPDYVAPPAMSYNTPVDRHYMDRHYYGQSGAYFAGDFYSPFGFYYSYGSPFYGYSRFGAPRPVIVIIREGSNPTPVDTGGSSGGGGGAGGGGGTPPPPPQPQTRLLSGQGYTNGVQGGAAPPSNWVGAGSAGAPPPQGADAQGSGRASGASGTTVISRPAISRSSGQAGGAQSAQGSAGQTTSQGASASGAQPRQSGAQSGSARGASPAPPAPPPVRSAPATAPPDAAAGKAASGSSNTATKATSGNGKAIPATSGKSSPAAGRGGGGGER